MSGEKVIPTKEETLKDLKHALRLCNARIKYYNEKLETLLVEYKSKEELYPEVRDCEYWLIAEKIRTEAIAQAIYCLEHNVVR